MNTKTLKAIQVLSKIGKILSKITFICCIVGFCGCVVGIIGLAAGIPAIKISGESFDVILWEKAQISVGTLYATMAAGLFLSAGEAVVARFAELYFDRELKDGTPFNLGGAKQMLNLGIITICVSLGSQSLAAIVYAIFKATMADVAALDFGYGSAAAIGIMFILTSLICRHGAELTAPAVAEPTGGADTADVKEVDADPFDEEQK